MLEEHPAPTDPQTTINQTASAHASQQVANHMFTGAHGFTVQGSTFHTISGNQVNNYYTLNRGL